MTIYDAGRAEASNAPAMPSGLSSGWIGSLSLTVRTSLLAVISLLTVGLVGLAVTDLNRVWNDLHGARQMQQNNAVADLFLVSAGSWAAERGTINAALQASAPAGADVTGSIAKLRANADSALLEALRQVENGADFSGRAALLAKVRSGMAAVHDLRAQVDRQLAMESAQRDAAVRGRWVPTMTTLIMASQDLRIASQIIPGNALARSQLLQEVKQAVWVMSEFSGRERAAIGGVIASGSVIDPGLRAILAENRGRLEQAAAIVEAYASRDFADAKVSSALETVRNDFFGTFERVRQEVYSAGAEGNAYPLTAGEWITEATRGIDTLLALSEAISSAALVYTTNAADAGFQGAIASFSVLALAILLGGFAFWIVVARVTRPINGLTSVMSQLAGGDLDLPVPSTGRCDEIGQMARAVSVFREAGLEKLRLEAEAEEGRKLTEHERRQREMEKEAEASALQEVIAALGAGLGGLSDGDVSHRIEKPFAPSLDKLRIDFNESVSKLEQALLAIGENARTIHAGSEEIRTAADDLAKRTEMQAASVEETAAAVEQMTATVRDSSKRASEAGELVARTKSQAERSGEVVVRTVQAMSEIEASSHEIGNIIAVIDDIAFQTNLLALNAGVEAARAGDAGKGFAVVALEVRQLAQRSAEAAKEIKTLITNSSRQVQTGVELVDTTGKALQGIITEVQEINEHVAAIVRASREQSVGLEEINNAVNQMDHSAQQNAAMVEQSTAASHSLATEAASLTRLLGQFKLSIGATAGSVRSIAAHELRPAASPARSLMRKVAGMFGGGAAAATNGAASSEWEEL